MGGEVEDDDLHAVLNGLSPRTGDPLAATHGGTRVPGFDLTFSAPKSVSVAFGLGDAEVSREVREAHEFAVAGALDYMERHAAAPRPGRRGGGGAPGPGCR